MRNYRMQTVNEEIFFLNHDKMEKTLAHDLQNTCEKKMLCVLSLGNYCELPLIKYKR